MHWSCQFRQAAAGIPYIFIITVIVSRAFKVTKNNIAACARARTFECLYSHSNNLIMAHEKL